MNKRTDISCRCRNKLNEKSETFLHKYMAKPIVKKNYSISDLKRSKVQKHKSKQSARNRTKKMLQVYAGSVKDLISHKYINDSTRLALVVLPFAMLHRADESQPARNSCPLVPHSVDPRFGFGFGWRLLIQGYFCAV